MSDAQRRAETSKIWHVASLGNSELLRASQRTFAVTFAALGLKLALEK